MRNGRQQHRANAGIDGCAVVDVIIAHHQRVLGGNTHSIESDTEQVQLWLDGAMLARQYVGVHQVVEVVMTQNRPQIERHIADDDNRNMSLAQIREHCGRVDVW